MSSTLIDISAKIDPELQAFFTELDAVASASGTAYFVVGATARDMILTLAYGIAAMMRAMPEGDFDRHLQLLESLLTGINDQP